MLDSRSVEVVAGVNKAIGAWKVKGKVKGGQKAAEAVVDLMAATVKRLPPMKVIDSFNGQGGTRVGRMWDDLGADTVKCMAEGAKTLATLWQSAWLEGGGAKVPSAQLKAVPEKDLVTLYNSKAIMTPVWLKNM